LRLKIPKNWEFEKSTKQKHELFDKSTKVLERARKLWKEHESSGKSTKVLERARKFWKEHEMPKKWNKNLKARSNLINLYCETKSLEFV